MTLPARIVISYSHKDESYRESLVSALSPAIRAGELEIWSDHHIPAGGNIDEQIMAQLKEADGVILLVSHDFVASDYCFQKELEVALERHKNGRSVVLPVLIRPTDFVSLPFARLKFLPTDAKAVSTWSNTDEAWLSISRGIREAISSIPDTPEVPKKFSSKNIRECLAENFDELQRRYGATGSYLTGETGFRQLNDIIDGVSRKELVLLAGRPGSGFEELCTSIVEFSAIKHKHRILILSQRFSAQKYANRLVCSVGFISLADLHQGQLDDDDWTRVTASIRLLKETNITIDDQVIRSIDDLRSKLNHVKSKKYDLVIFDGLEYLSTESHKNEKAIALLLRDFCLDIDSAFICTLSLGQQIDRRSYRRPMMIDLDNWGVLEQIGHKIIFTFRQDVYDLLGQDYGQVSEFTVTVAKNSIGRLGDATLRLHTFSGAVSEPLDHDPSETT